MKPFAMVVVVGLLFGCASWYEGSADRETLPIVNRLNSSVQTELPKEVPAGVLTPKPEGPSVESTSNLTVLKQEPLEIVTLNQALTIAFSSSRDYLFQKESLYLSSLAFTAVRHEFDWQPKATLTGSVTGQGFADSTGNTMADTTTDATATLSLTRKLLSGGEFDVSGTVDRQAEVAGTGVDKSSHLSATFTQPLLAGAGIAARDTLIQATRSLLYDARDFELFREQLALDIISSYYDLLRQKRFITTAKAKAEQSEFLYDRSDALFKKGKTTLVDVFRAEQEKLQAENGLSEQIATYNLSLDRFKIELNIPTAKPLDVADEPIEPSITDVDVEGAVKTGLANRLDLLTAKQQLIDSQRRVEVTRNLLLPQLNLFVNGRSNGEPNDLDDFSRATSSVTTGVTLVLPLDQLNERNHYKEALISLARQRRAYQLAEDNAVAQVREDVRALKEAEVTLVIQKKSLQVSTDQLEAARLLFDKGQADNRSIVDAQNQLQSAENSYVQAQVNYVLGYIRLRKDIGVLRVDEQGRWR
jgi:outer membrane protein